MNPDAALDPTVLFCEQIAQQIAIAWELPTDAVFTDPASSDQPSHDYATIFPDAQFTPGPNGCDDDAQLTVTISGRFKLPEGAGALDMLRARGRKNALARLALSYSAAINPDVPRIGNTPYVNEANITEPETIDPGFYKVLVTFNTTYQVARGPFVPPGA